MGEIEIEEKEREREREKLLASGPPSLLLPD
jgi:hypothetical protein